MAPPTSLFLFLTPTLSFSLNHLLLSCFPFPSSFFSLFFLFLQQIFQTQTNLTAAIIALPPLSHRRQQPKSSSSCWFYDGLLLVLVFGFLYYDGLLLILVFGFFYLGGTTLIYGWCWVGVVLWFCCWKKIETGG